MKQKTIKEMEPCPRCGSKETGIIQAIDGFSFRRQMEKLEKGMKKGYLIKTVSPEEYRNYYLPYGVTGFCETCGYEFRGKLEEKMITPDELKEYNDLHGLTKYQKPEKKGIFRKLGEKALEKVIKTETKT